MKKDVYPELMSERELAESFRELEKQMHWEMISWLRDPRKRVEILEQLMESDHTQYRCAILLMLSQNADRISSDWRLFLLPYLMDLLSDDSGAVRLGAMDCAGHIIAREYENEPSVWQDCLRRILFVSKDNPEEPGVKYAGNALRGLLEIVYNDVPESAKKSVLSGYSSYFKSTKWGQDFCVSLLGGVSGLPYTVWGAMQRGNILGFVRHFLKNGTGEVRLAALLLLDKWLRNGWKPAPDFALSLRGVLKTAAGQTEDLDDLFPSQERSPGQKGAAALTWIAGRVLAQLQTDDGSADSETEETDAERNVPRKVKDGILFRENLDSNVPSIVKHINLRLLKERYAGNAAHEGLSGYASHLLIFMRLNTEPALFTQAGEDLLQIMDLLEDDQKQEIMMELIKCVELEEDSSHYLPYLIGECWQHIPSSMQMELVPELQRLCNSDRVQTLEIVMGAACEILGHLDMEIDPKKRAGDADVSKAASARSAQPGLSPYEVEENTMKIRRSMSGMLCQGIYSDRRIVAENTAYCIGYDLFRKQDGSAASSSDIREPIVAVARSVLLYLRGTRDSDPLYRYPTVREIARYLEEIGQSYADPKRPVAYFSGSFDPFSNGHRAVAKEVAEMGYQVYVNVDDFSWNRNTQPLAVRRKIAMLSIADLAHVRIFPQELVINPDNPEDLARLRGLFPDQKVYLVCGSDRIERDEAYQAVPSEGSVHSFPHIVFTRNEDFGQEDDGTEHLTGEVIRLMLPVYYEHMTSLQIRYNLQEGKSIDDLVTIPARQYIRRNKLYADERIYKKEPKTRPLDTLVEKSDDTIRVSLIDKSQNSDSPVVGVLIAKICADPQEKAGRPSRDLEILSLQTDFREKASVEDSEVQAASDRQEDSSFELEEILLDEALLVFQAEGFENVYSFGEAGAGDFREMLRERGFFRIQGDRYRTDLRTPLVLFGDASDSILEPFSDDPALLKVQRENIHRLRRALANLHPGKTVLFVDSGILNYRITKSIREKITTDEFRWDGGKSSEQDLEISAVSPWVCVPFGKMLKYVRLSGLTTVTLNTEKVYEPDISGFRIRESAGYPNLSIQIRNLRSIGKPFVLVDDFYHEGYRMQEISQSLRKEGLQEEKLIVGVLSGRGKTNANRSRLSVESVYEIPNMIAGILESDLIPFYGGDRVKQAYTTRALPSIYPILPYQMPPFLQDAPYQAVYDLSRICLDNARRLFEVLEALYEKRHFRRLTLERLGDVIDEPGCPDTIADSASAPGEAVSVLLAREITRLKRFYMRQP